MREITDYKRGSALQKKAEDVLVLRTNKHDLNWYAEVCVIQRGATVTTVDLNLGTPKGYSGRKIIVKNGDNTASNITVTAPVVTLEDGTTYQSKIDGQNTVVIAKAYGYVEILSDGENFHILRADLS